MLKPKRMVPGSIVSLRILNGDELIARLKEETQESITLTYPMVFTITPEGAGVVPWFALGDTSEVNIKTSHIFSIVPAKLEATQEYTENMAKMEHNA
jgi:hypothetical protein